MKRPLRFTLVLIAALALVPFLPLYIERTRLQSRLVNPAPDIIDWGWKLNTLGGYWADYKYFTPEHLPELWLGVNLALGLIYALVIAFVIDKFFARRASRADKLLK